jgi:hypothetical protein
MAGGSNIVARVHTWVHQKHLKTDFFGIDVKSDLIVSSSQKIQISSTVASGIRLGIEYQSYRGLSQISNGY